MNDLLILLALSWLFRKGFVGATLENVEDFFNCDEVAGEDMAER